MKLENKDIEYLRERFGDLGADVYTFNQHINSNSVPFWCASDADVKMFMLKRIGFISEEVSELALATAAGNAAAVADAVVDLLYFTIGTAVLMDIPLKRIWDAVHDANMRKTEGKTKRGVVGDAAKPADFTPPDVGAILKNDAAARLQGGVK